MILCGGKGTRLRDVTELLPKPMVPIGKQPIIWHIMRSYASFGITRFILCLGYKREEFIDYFLNYHARSTDITVKLGRNRSIVYHDISGEDDWEVTLADTGQETMTAGRIRLAARYLNADDRYFHLTYGCRSDSMSITDGNSSQTAKIAHAVCGKSVRRFGETTIEKGIVKGFSEKPVICERHINGGFVMEKAFIDKYIPKERDMFLESEPIAKATADDEAAAYFHQGFWQCMDTHVSISFLTNSGIPAAP